MSTGGPMVCRRAKRVCVSNEVRHSSMALKRLFWSLFNCADYSISRSSYLAGHMERLFKPHIFNEI